MDPKQKIINIFSIGIGLIFICSSMAMAQSYHLVDGYKFNDPRDKSSLEEPIFRLRLKYDPKENWATTGRNMRNAAAFMKLQAGHTTEKGKHVLNNSIAQLEHLARAIEKKEAVSVEEVENAYAKAMLALAQHYHLKAYAAWNRKEWDKAEKELVSSAYYLKNASRWAKQETKVKINTTASEIEEFYGQLLLREGESLERLGNKIEAFQKGFPSTPNYDWSKD